MVYVLSFNFAFPPLDAFENSGKNFPYFCANGKNHEIMKQGHTVVSFFLFFIFWFFNWGNTKLKCWKLEGLFKEKLAHGLWLTIENGKQNFCYFHSVRKQQELESFLEPRFYAAAVWIQNLQQPWWLNLLDIFGILISSLLLPSPPSLTVLISIK